MKLPIFNLVKILVENFINIIPHKLANSLPFYFLKNEDTRTDIKVYNGFLLKIYFKKIERIFLYQLFNLFVKTFVAHTKLLDLLLNILQNLKKIFQKKENIPLMIVSNY